MSRPTASTSASLELQWLHLVCAGRAALEAINGELGLAFDEWGMQ